MSVEFPQHEINREGFAQTRYNQLTRLVAVDMLFSEIVSERNQLGEMGHMTSPDAIKVLQETQSLLHLSIFNTWASLIDTGSPLALQGLAIMQAGRDYQQGKMDAIAIGDNISARGVLERYLTQQMGIDYENTYLKQERKPPPHDSF